MFIKCFVRFLKCVRDFLGHPVRYKGCVVYSRSSHTKEILYTFDDILDTYPILIVPNFLLSPLYITSFPKQLYIMAK